MFEIYTNAYGLFIDGQELVIEAEYHIEDLENNNKVNIHWNLQKIVVPNEVLNIYSIEELRKWIQEAFMGFGSQGFTKEEIEKVIVQMDVDLEKN